MPVVKRKVLVFCMTVLFSLSCAVTALASFQRGDDGQEVVAIQKRLVELSYSINNIDGDFGPETDFRNNAEWTSLTLLSIIAMADEEYDVTLTGDEIRSCKTIQDIFEIVKSKQNLT